MSHWCFSVVCKPIHHSISGLAASQQLLASAKPCSCSGNGKDPKLQFARKRSSELPSFFFFFCHVREKWRANNIALWSQNALYSLIKLLAPALLNLWTCFGAQDELTLPAKWTVNIILRVIPLLLYRRLKDFSPASFSGSLGFDSLSVTLRRWQPWPIATAGSIFGLADLLDGGSCMSVYISAWGIWIRDGPRPVPAHEINDFRDERGRPDDRWKLLNHNYIPHLQHICLKTGAVRLISS